MLRASAVFSAMSAAMADAAKWAFDGMEAALTATTTPDLGATWFSGPDSHCRPRPKNG